MNKLQIYKASAGSGKTYNLTLYYLKSAFKYPDNFTKILAVTFTNKAAEEMKTRILEKLDKLIKDGKNADYYPDIVNNYNIETENELKKRAEKVRDNILHNYSAFSVSTIDSFVQKVVRAFSFEMNLNSSYDIELDSEKVIDDLTKKLYENISENKDLQKWLSEFANSKIEEGKNWDFKNEIKQLASEIFKERFQELYHNKSTNFDKKEMADFLSELYKIKKSFEDKMSGFVSEYENVLSTAGLNYENLGYKFKTISNHFFRKITNKEYDNFSVTILKAREGVENWYKKTEKPEIIEQISSVYEKLSQITNNYFELLENESEDYYTAEQIIKNFHSFGIINDLAGYLPDYRAENNVLLISDTTLLLKQIIGNNDAPFIYEKIGNRYNNILIDEFQDTSGFQWANFKPLILNSLSQGFSNLIVGDIKQSIYRWRGGDWKLLYSGIADDIGKNYIKEKPLDTNWRSKKNIIEFNNTIFNLMPKLLQNLYNEKLNNILNEEVKDDLIRKGYDKIIINAYADQSQKIPDKPEKAGGKVKLFFWDSKEYTDKLHQYLPEIIDKMLLNENKKPKDIGILVRTNKQAKEITELLTENQNLSPEKAKYKIISGDSLYISYSISVRILISALKYINNPEDKINTAQLIFNYQKITNKKVGLNDIFLSLDSEEYKIFLPEEFINRLNNLAQSELFDLTESLISIFKLTSKIKEFAYIKAFQDLTAEFTQKRYSDLNEFLDFWNEKGQYTSLTISDKTNAVTVMTIHKSKGLAFNTVLMPYTDFKLDHSAYTAPVLWAKTEKKPFNHFEYLPVKYSGKLAKTSFRKDYFDEMLYSYTDALNLIYVAFTRAENELISFVKYKETNKTGKSDNKISDTASLIYNIINQDINYRVGESRNSISLKKYYDTESKIFEISETNTITDIKQENTENIIYPYPENKYPNNKWQDKLSIKLSSEDFFIESIPEIEEKVNYGKLMHEIFKNIITKADVNSAVKKQFYEGILTREEQSALIKKITGIISDKKVKSWFDGTYDVINEEELLTIKGDKKIPDRVLLSENELIVIDFKFGQFNKKYKDQISEYKKILKEIYKIDNTRAFIFFPEENKITEVL